MQTKFNFSLFTFAIYFLALTVTSNSDAEIAPEEYFAEPHLLSAKISPDGKKVAIIKNLGESGFLTVLNTDTWQEKNLFDLDLLTTNDAAIRSLNWIDNQHLGAEFVQLKEGVKDLLDTRLSKQTLVVKVPPSNGDAEIYSIRTAGWLIDPLPAEPNKFLYAKSGANSKIYKLSADQLSLYGKALGKLERVDGGQFNRENEIASTSGYVTRWFTDENYEPVAALAYVERDTLSLVKLTEDEEAEENALAKWTTEELSSSSEDLKDNLENKKLLPVAYAGEENTFYCLDFAEDEERSIYKVNFEENEEELVYQTGGYKIVDVILSETRALLGAQVLQNGELQEVYIDPSLDSGFSSESKSSFSSFVGSSLDQNLSLIYEESHDQPGKFILNNNITGDSRSIGGVFPHLDNRLDSELVEGQVQVGDQTIPYLLTLPKNSNSPHPLVLMPHGGPIAVFDDRYFDLRTQFLAANGFAVLRVNFRGSSGFSPELQEAGKGQWGKLMIDDLYQATQEVIQRPDIDQQRVCVAGSSYGGYAATALTIQHKETFACAVNSSGVSDLNLYLNSPYASDRQDYWMMEYIGDTLTEYDDLHKLSTTTQAALLERPILITHGGKDRVVDIEHAYRLKLMLDKYSKPYEWKLYPEQGHGPSDAEEQIALYGDILSFLNEHLK